MEGARVSFVEGSEAGLMRLATARPWRVERVDHSQMPVHLAVTEDDAGELLAAVSLGDRSWVDRLARRLGARLVAGDGRSRAAVQLREYLDGGRCEFDLRLIAIGSEFERQAWAALTLIPFGETRSYAEQARMLGRSPTPGAGEAKRSAAPRGPSSARAVGRANGRNPIPIVVPCHRVIGSDGSLTGFAGGLALKRWLLAHEGVGLPAEAGPRLAAVNQLGLFGSDHG